ncbi:MAG: hypothetical protein H0U57_14045 [Tatlockia sp.]|nr:hypothetical protein [Tatlockia sp.]
MKIRSKSSELIIEVYSHFLFRFWAYMFIAAGLIFLLPMLVQYQIICEEKNYNKANLCVLRTGLLKIYYQKITLGVLKSAAVSSFVEGRDNSISYCLLLYTSEGYIKIPNISSKKNQDIVQIADSVKHYIKNSTQQRITIPKLESLWSYLKVAIFPLLGLGSLFFRLITIRLSKKTKKITIACKNIINTHKTTIPLQDVSEVIIVEHGQNHKEYSLCLGLKNGEHIDLPGVHDSNLKSIQDLVKKINPFLSKSIGDKKFL